MERVETQKPSRHWRFSVANYDTLLPPGPLAEHVDADVALAAMRHCMTLRKPEGHFHSAWRHIEFAMNQNVSYLSDELRRKYLGDAQWLLAGILDARGDRHGRNTNPDLYAQALTLNIFLPVLTKRALGKSLDSTDCESIYRSFGTAFASINALQYPDASYKCARFAEMLGPALSARTRRPSALLYPASPREEASTIQPLNHDGYFIKGDRKLPLQTKLIRTEKLYHDPTMTIYIEPLADHALRRSGVIGADAEPYIGDCTEIIAELITEECAGNDDPAGKAALDYLTRSVVARYEYETTAA
jgi:hypothetical protein